MIDFLVAIFEWFGGWTIPFFVFIFLVLFSLFGVLLFTLPSSSLKPLLNKPKRKPLISENTKEKIRMFLWKWFVIIVFILLIISYFTHPSSNSIKDTGWLRWSKGW